ncbi:pyridoxamine 5'-phosphate oxidase family protein [Streptomyces sp. PA03-1a]|nr:pyridoxamine 5'-phosphate oxidase family protein [Streptomyces sp. PA03-1a]
MAAQTRAGVRLEANRIRPMIGRALPLGASDFLARQRMLIIGGSDQSGRVWASALYGEPGFIRVRDPNTLEIAAVPVDVDPLAEALRTGTRLGTLSIDFARRRRLRVNGRVTPLPDGLLLSVDQAYGNCPQYIQSRTAESAPRAGDRLASRSTDLGGPQQKMIAIADTFFVASLSTDGDADVSHRGGNPGFVRVVTSNHLIWPDYHGNNMLMTLGNIVENPAAGLLFVDWQSATSLQLTGAARINWDPQDDEAFPEANRVVEFESNQVVQIEHHSDGLTWSVPGFSRFNPPV